MEGIVHLTPDEILNGVVIKNHLVKEEERHDSSDDCDGEELDPRVEGALMALNKATDDINTSEGDLEVGCDCITMYLEDLSIFFYSINLFLLYAFSPSRKLRKTLRLKCTTSKLILNNYTKRYAFP